ncbi:predicted protein [Naegleria gruberi]|uniref:Predicted protein n=1 Tax=Naegleria gruberi TaxID=5762 RepID=D2VFA0_NAEGR|nr:uncharacterized protein NAEGRDRAFT_79729 [Naegleria gruberi]EFC44423.1 predicted protein [Naegleria gruberi]|eukprot:XP_002677167.1 predicted protein [Naegleria gruberi strain NEG-M]
MQEFESSSSPRLLALIVVVLAVSLLWLLSVRLKNTAIIDPFWGFGFVLVGLVHLMVNDYSWNVHQWMLIGMMMAWGLRLSLYLGRRFVREGVEHEDYRYANFRKNDPESYWWKSLMKVFWLQGLLIWIFSQVVQSVLCQTLRSELTSSAVFWIDAICWLIGVLFETFGDLQLESFKSKPENKGKVLNTGLWRYTRHPNYFGDSMVWIGFGVMSLGINFAINYLIEEFKLVRANS